MSEGSLRCMSEGQIVGAGRRGRRRQQCSGERQAARAGGSQRQRCGNADRLDAAVGEAEEGRAALPAPTE